jgi:hypothetical protein|tara:strand:+ start:394 stop:642 length:249 start_codon:yes stop_codon:yes gene_type:complete
VQDKNVKNKPEATGPDKINGLLGSAVGMVSEEEKAYYSMSNKERKKHRALLKKKRMGTFFSQKFVIIKVLNSGKRKKLWNNF